MDRFWTLTDDEIRAGLEIIRSTERMFDAMRNHHPQVNFAWDIRMRRMAVMLEACGWDRDLMRLKHADELLEMNDPNVKYLQWYGSGTWVAN